MDVVDVGADFVGVLELPEAAEQFHVQPTRLDGDDVDARPGLGRQAPVGKGAYRTFNLA